MLLPETPPTPLQENNVANVGNFGNVANVGNYENVYGNIVDTGNLYNIDDDAIDKAADDSGSNDNGILSFLGLKNLKKKLGITDILGVKLKEGGSIKKVKNYDELFLLLLILKTFFSIRHCQKISPNFLSIKMWQKIL